MARKRKTYEAPFNAKVALAALQGDKTANEVGSDVDVHPTLASQCKEQLLEHAHPAFAPKPQATERALAALQAPLFEQIGRLQMELDWLKKNSHTDPDELRRLVEPGHPQMSIRRQCELLGLPRA